MSIATPVSAPTPSGRARRFGFSAGIRALLYGLSESIEVVTRYRILRKLTDEELAGLGLTRRDIPRAAVNGWQN